MSLEPFRSVSEPVDRLHRLCEVLCNVAALYFEAKQSSQQQQKAVASGQRQQPQLHQSQRQQGQHHHHQQNNNGGGGQNYAAAAAEAATNAISNEFETYLNQAGLPPMDFDGTLHAMGLGFQTGDHPEAMGLDGGGGGGDAQASQAANWYFGYMNMMGWSELSPSSWPR